MPDDRVRSIKIIDTGVNNQVDIDPSVTAGLGFSITLSGSNNHLIIGEKTKLGAGMIELRNHDSSVVIGAHCTLTGSFRCRARKTHIRIGDYTTSMMAHITLHEAGTISLGSDCMLSGDITMDVSDMHSILDMVTGNRVNPPRDIAIADHVWLAQGVRVMKGAQIGRHAIIGSRSMVMGDIPAYALAVGSPARVVRTGVTWDRRRLPVESHSLGANLNEVQSDAREGSGV